MTTLHNDNDPERRDTSIKQRARPLAEQKIVEIIFVRYHKASATSGQPPTITIRVTTHILSITLQLFAQSRLFILFPILSYFLSPDPQRVVTFTDISALRNGLVDVLRFRL
jgi:hypothetical protein